MQILLKVRTKMRWYHPILILSLFAGLATLAILICQKPIPAKQREQIVAKTKSPTKVLGPKATDSIRPASAVRKPWVTPGQPHGLTITDASGKPIPFDKKLGIYRYPINKQIVIRIIGMRQNIQYFAAFKVAGQPIRILNVPRNPIKVKLDRTGACIVRVMDSKSYEEADKGVASDRKIKNGIDSTVRILFEAPSQQPARR